MEYLKFDLNPSNVARFKFYSNRVLMSNGLFYSNLDPKSFFFIFFRWGGGGDKCSTAGVLYVTLRR